MRTLASTTWVPLLVCISLVTVSPATYGAAPIVGPLAAALSVTSRPPAASIEIEDQYAPYEPIVARVTADATLYFWEFDEDVLGVRELDDGRTLHIWAPHGTHKLKCMLVTIDWEKQTANKSTVRAVFVVGEPDPDPEPEPDPDPDPQPDQKYQVGFFLQSDQRDNLPRAQQAILASLTLRTELAKRGHKLLGIYDVDLTSPDGIPTKLKPWWIAVKDKTLPKIALAPLAGGKIVLHPLPADSDALWKLLEGGK